MAKPNYYVLQRANDDRYPLFESDDPNRRPLFRAQWVTLPAPLVIRLGAPVPDDPVLVDYHSMPQHVFSRRLADAILALEPENVQLIPAMLHFRDKTYEYAQLHAAVAVSGVLDMNRSRFSPSGSILKSISLHYDRIAELPEKQRLLIALKEEARKFIFHEDVKRAIEATGGVGFRFIHVDDWTDGSSFK
ncbi:MAG: hypothetical protein KA712_10345 [Myxococcales bacterium]|nr:hypothetical protein [Myxococcales bacterium]